MAHNAIASALARDGNQMFWGQQGAPQLYAGRSALYPPEHIILSRIARDCQGRPILDLGVGAGRTTAALLGVSADYLGIDYSPAMIQHCREQFPGVAFRHDDVRDLGQLRERHYALIMFSFNGLDYISHDERLKSLRRLATLLASDGWFVFSSHNRLCRVLPPWDLRNLTAGPVKKLPGRLWAYCQGVMAYRANRGKEYEAPDHALRIDNAFNYGLVTYYISPTDQLAQLRASGFAPVNAFGMNGDLVDASGSPTDSWLYYTARSDA
jgi:SAM-dependent methyltransferase